MVVGLEIGVAVVVEGVAAGDLAFDAADSEVHLRQPPGRVVRLLAVDRDVACLPKPRRRQGPGPSPIAVALGVRADELHRLHEHARRAAAGVVDAATVGLEHFDKELHHAARRVELTAFLALGARELREEVLVHAAEHVLGAARFVADLDVADQVDQLAEARLVERGAGVVLRQHAFERRVVAFDGGHGVVHDLPDRGLPGLRPQVRPARLARDPKDVLGAVLIRVLGVGAVGLLCDKLCVVLLEGIRDVLEEDETEHDMLVFGGVHAAAQGVGHAPQLGFVADGGAGGLDSLRSVLSHG